MPVIWYYSLDVPWIRDDGGDLIAHMKLYPLKIVAPLFFVFGFKDKALSQVIDVSIQRIWILLYPVSFVNHLLFFFVYRSKWKTSRILTGYNFPLLLSRFLKYKIMIQLCIQTESLVLDCRKLKNKFCAIHRLLYLKTIYKIWSHFKMMMKMKSKYECSPWP